MPQPAIILADPQMGENIGAAARAMLNCGLTDLRLVRPRDGWPNERADAMSSGALSKMPPVRVYESVTDAVAECRFVLATTARSRDQIKPVYTARSAAEEIHKQENAGRPCAILFGAERTGLTNDDVALADAVMTLPLNPDFSSLNLAQAVLLLCYEWWMIACDPPDFDLPTGDSVPVEHRDLEEMLERLETELAAHHFFRNEDMRPTMVRNIRNMLTRSQMTDQEVRTFHGIISALIGKKEPPS